MVMDFWLDDYEGEYALQAYIDGGSMTDYVDAIFDRIEVPGSFASVGCGPAVT